MTRGLPLSSPERLKLLLLLTVADIRAVGPKVWNGWKATLLRELYARVAEVLAGGLSTTERDVRVQRAKTRTVPGGFRLRDPRLQSGELHVAAANVVDEHRVRIRQLLGDGGDGGGPCAFLRCGGGAG